MNAPLLLMAVLSGQIGTGPAFDPAVDFELGIAAPVVSLESARGDPLWVERDLRGYELSEREPWTFTLYYGDGSRIVVPLSRIWFGQPEGRVVTLFRRHKETRRLIPFVMTIEPPAEHERTLPSQEVIRRKAVPRFDPKLTPQIVQALNEAQIVFAATGTLAVFQWQAMNPVLLGAPLAAPAAAVRRTAMAQAAVGPGSRLVPGGGLAAHEAAGGHLLARHVGLTDAQLAGRIASEGLRKASTFSSRAVAEEAACEAIEANQVVISTWLRNGAQGKLELDYLARGTVGRVLLQGATKAVETSKLRLVLVRDATFPFGWRILTGMATP